MTRYQKKALSASLKRPGRFTVPSLGAATCAVLLHVVVAIHDASRRSHGISIGAVQAVARLASFKALRVTVATEKAVTAWGHLCRGGVCGRNSQGDGNENLYRNV